MAPETVTAWYTPYMAATIGFLISTLFLLTGWLGRRNVVRIDKVETGLNALLQNCATSDDVKTIHKRLDRILERLAEK